MPDWQLVVTLVIIAAAAGYLLRGLRRSFHSAHGACGGCVSGAASIRPGSASTRVSLTIRKTDTDEHSA